MPFKQSNGLTSVLLILNGTVQTPMMMNALVAQIGQFFQKIKNVQKMVLTDRKFKLREIADTLKISESSVFTICMNL